MRANDQRELIEELLGITELTRKAEALKEVIKETKDQIKDEEYSLKAKEDAEKLLKDKGDQKDFAEASSQLTQSLSQLRAIEALKKNIKLKK